MNNRGCASIMFGALATLALLVLLSSLMRNGDDRRTSTVERVLQPAASVQLEAQQLSRRKRTGAHRRRAHRTARSLCVCRRAHAGWHDRAAAVRVAVHAQAARLWSNA
jgi:hypothetical protein